MRFVAAFRLQAAIISGVLNPALSGRPASG